MKGLGDNIFMRPFVRAACARGPVYLTTPWPELYSDMPARLVRPATRLRTQLKNMDRPGRVWEAQPPARVVRVNVGYGSRDLSFRSVTRSLEAQMPLQGHPFVFDLPDFGPPPFAEPYVLVRPATVRTEWQNEARNPLPRYLHQLTQWLGRDYLTISVADLAPGHEWLVRPGPGARLEYHGGEWSVEQLVRLVRGAAAVVGGVGWIVPMAVACGTPLFTVLGGHGMHNAPERVTDPRMDLSRVGWARPDRFCKCDDMRHRCDKIIGNLDEQFRGWRDAVGV